MDPIDTILANLESKLGRLTRILDRGWIACCEAKAELFTFQAYQQRQFAKGEHQSFWSENDDKRLAHLELLDAELMDAYEAVAKDKAERAMWRRRNLLNKRKQGGAA